MNNARPDPDPVPDESGWPRPEDLEGLTDEEICETLIRASRAKSGWPRPEDLGAPTDEEICEAVNRASPAAQIAFTDAASELFFAKWLCGNKTPWRQQVCDHRAAGGMGQVELEVVDSDGKPRAQMVYMDLRSVPNKDVARLFAAVARLAKAMNMVEADAKKKTMESQKKATAAGEKHKDSRALGEWAKANARSGNKEEARRLHRSMPEEVLILASRLVDPERVIYDAIRKKRKSI